VGHITSGITGEPAPRSPRERLREPPEKQAGAGTERAWVETLARAAQRLERSAKRREVVAWQRTPGRELRWIAASGEQPNEGAPPAALHDALSALPHATDLGSANQPEELRRFAEESGFSSAVAITDEAEHGATLLLLRDPRDRPGRVRPRTLAALQASADRLCARKALSRRKGHGRATLLDRDLQRLDRLASLGDLVAEIVHEVRNPMVALKTFLRMLPERLDDREFIASFLDVADEEVNRIERLLNAVLNYARPSPLHPTISSDVRDALRTVEFLLTYRASERSIHLDVQQDLPPLPALISPDQLRQVGLNLTMNAIDATPPGGTVRLRAEPSGDAILLCVEDQGKGIPPEYRERIFEPFFSTKSDRPGGLGLGISRHLVEEAGGSLRVSERPGGGSIFQARLPAGD